ncbi:Uncharacterised protein [Staphylococcus lugdunensis]|uniref:sigS mRNA-stabilizing protein SroA n=1 Tax=Staphylococcus lugdunensis TaxID=28035 RepID=UPI000DA2D226|nr:hypothetical protein [Staphylococcus lugdunensis]SQE72513.1 Uncharacterised protein [Staphylococcus lugdunensis]
MNQINQLTVQLTEIKLNDAGKAQEQKRRFAKLNPQATADQIKSFFQIISQLTGLKFDKVEAIKTEEIV